jgi:hypothetical protein
MGIKILVDLSPVVLVCSVDRVTLCRCAFIPHTNGFINIVIVGLMAATNAAIAAAPPSSNGDSAIMRLWLRGLAHSSFAKRYCSSLRLHLNKDGT